jgi:hypothetical protein
MIRSHSRHSFPSAKPVPQETLRRELSRAARRAMKDLHHTKSRQLAQHEIREALVEREGV